jgi:uncharacterized coiled-coil protein SlyX
MFRIKTHLLIGIFLILGPPGLWAQQADSVTLSDLHQMLQKQQKMIESQNKQIEAQQQTINDQNKALKSLSTRLDEVAQNQAQAVGADIAPPTGDQVSVRERLAALEKEAADEPEAPANVLTAGEFPGSIRIPGTNMAGKVGGFVRLGVVNSFEPIGSDDRFIVGTIPVPGGEAGGSTGDATSGLTISAKRSRMNLDMRMDSSVGQFRAFIEGDFATESEGSDVYRLRHAYGQYNRFILGQTWTTFMDRQAEPEELDFEGLNSEILERHPIMRWTKGLGNQRAFAVAIEDPSTEVPDSLNKSRTPDVVSTINWQKPWGHFQLGGLIRSLSAEQTIDMGDDDTEDDQTRSEATLGWGLSASGSHTMKPWGKKDVFMWQVNLGDGIGRYINDLDSVGGQDAVFDPDGSLRALPAFGGYIALKHYWKRDPTSYFGGKNLLKDLRSTLVYGFVDVDNFDFQPTDAYKRTQRASINLIWSPISPIDLGVEYLWGTRKNKDGNRGRSSQFQLVATFKF